MKRIQVKGVSKTFKGNVRKYQTLLSYMLGDVPKSQQSGDTHILNNVSFDVASGEVLGIIGNNGAGKSTLLRAIAGIYAIDSGSIETVGKVVYLTSSGAGFFSRLTMIENIFLMGSIMGVTRAEMKRRLPGIIDFSGLRDFTDMKLYQFSTGMASRLYFSTLIHCLEYQNPDILLLDELLSAGGDIDFQNKALKKMEELIRGGASVVLVSHSMSLVQKYCSRVIVLHDGSVSPIDPSHCAEYSLKIGATKQRSVRTS